MPELIVPCVVDTLGHGGGDLREVVGWNASGSPYPIADQLVQGDAGRAVSGIENLFAGGFVGKDGSRNLDRVALVTMLLAALSAKVREALAGSDVIARGGDPKRALTVAGVRGPQAAQQAFLGRLRLHTPEQWRACLDQVAALERRARSGA